MLRIPREDRAVVLALLTIAAAPALNAAVSWSPPHPIEQPKQQTNPNSHHEPKGPEPWWVRDTFWEAIATGIIAVYAIRQYGEAQRSAERQLRAYVFVDNVVAVLGPNSCWQAVIKVRNFGLTPAYDAVLRVEAGVRDRK